MAIRKRFLGFAFFLAFAAPVQAQQAGGDFTFKRVTVGEPSAGKRITVQIDPTEEVFRITPDAEPRKPGDPRPPSAAVVPNPGQADPFSWYWQLVSPKRETDVAARFQAALAAVENEPALISAPRIQTLSAIVQAHGLDILKSTIGTNVSPALVLAVIHVESGGKTNALSSAGAQGLMQLIPDTAARFGVSDSNNAPENIKGGTAYLNWLLDEFNRDPVMALAAYNAGEGAVQKYEGVPPFAETRGYVPKVLSAWLVARQLCATPPDLMTDGCVFVGPNQLAGN